MSDFDVPMTEMNNEQLTNENVEALLSGDPAAGSGELHELLSGLQQGFARSADVPVHGALREFLDVVDLTNTTTSGLTAAPSRRNKVLAGIGTFVATTTGKIVLGTAVAAASVGGAHAAEIVEVPGLPVPVEDVVETEDLPTADTVVDAIVEDTLAGESADDDVADVVAPDTDDQVDDVDESDESDESDDNHGQTVSEFVHSTDLEGCEKGQAVSALASSKAADKRNNVADEDTADKCKDKSDDDDSDETEHENESEEDHDDDDMDDDADDESGDGEKANGADDKGKPESAGNKGKGSEKNAKPDNK